MSGVDDLASLWQREPDAEETRLFAEMARSTGRRAWLLDKVEFGTSLVLSIAIFVFLLLNGTLISIAIGAVIIAAIAWSTWQRHRLMRQSGRFDERSRQAFLDSAVGSAKAAVRRSTIGTALLIPGFALGTMLKYSAIEGTLRGYLDAEVSTWSNAHGWLSHGLVFAALIYFVSVNLKLRRQLERVETLRREYVEELKLDGA